ncbi:MAG: hypothetical protein A2X35_11695 [Elusimicrobia bacterium GWA2_61_42]|nr:MAG: hypothetical protein A2X35_11695 [Elusimicrobia bacterium GWA2_61_42]OGR75802.1 MAG: hypothetical protein A2X38_07220 [Elusimicrobia bacterium GWC2_61_25]
MFKDGYFTPSGIKIYSSVAHNVAGFDPTNTDDQQTKDALRKYQDRGREIMSENSEDALTWSFFHAVSKLPTKDWLVDFFRAAVNDRFANTHAPHADQAIIRFWVAHPSPPVYLQWIGAKVLQEGEGSISHLERYDSKVRARKRLAKIMRGDPDEVPERATEVDVEIRLGKELLVFIEVKLFSDASASGTFNSTRNQLVRNMELLEHAANREGFKDRRFILLTLDRTAEKLYTKLMRRYRNTDGRVLRQWDEVGNWQALKEDLPHRSTEPDAYFQDISKKLGWIMWPDCWKLLAHYASAAGSPCKP